MKENNREKIKDIFQAALERPLAEREQFLNEACQGDESLSDEVRGLLDSFEENDSFLEGAAIGELAEFIVESDERLITGARIGRYKIQSELGAGGMGRVFLAEDLELERLVALKILSSAFSSDSDGIRRFVQEAKSASALNHPNILTIYEVGQFEDLHFIATEYVRGDTLRFKQKQNALNLREILDITVQTASALNAAHEANIVHRDVKPENIMIRSDGLVKVLDFGLAKLVEKNQESLNAGGLPSDQVNTIPGLIMGTAAYMSPEQARGKATDAGTDIWSLGVCLYEMVAGFKPFTGETTSDIIASILKSEPQAFNTDVPAKLNRIIRKALQKKRENRYHNIKDLLADLKDLQQKSGVETGEWNAGTRGSFNYTAITDNSPGQPTTVKQSDTARIIESKPRVKNTALLALAAALFLSISVGVLYYLMPASLKTVSFETMRFEKLTYSGNILGEQVAISPDGKYTTYVVQEGGEQSLWVRHIVTSGNIQIVPPAKVDYGGLSFSRDGNYVYYSIVEKKGSTALYRVPVLGNESRKLLDNVERPVTFSPDGERMAVVSDERHLMIANTDGSQAQLLAVAAEGKRWNLIAWSPDGKTIVSSVFSSANNNTYLVEVAVKDGAEKSLNFPPWQRVSGIAWLPDSSGLILSGRDFETKLSQLWLIDYPEGKIKRVTNDLNSYLGVSITADGRTIASIQYERLSNIWSVSREDGRLARQVTFDKDKDEGMSGVALAPDGRIVYTARITGTLDLWTVNADGNGKRQLTFNARSNFSPVVSPDNRYIVFVSDRSGSSSIWKMDLNGDNPMQLTDSPGIAALPAFSPDGKWIIYQFTNTDNKTTIWKVNIEGGASFQLTDVHSGKPIVSPNGEFFACYYGQATADSQLKIAVITFSGGQPSQIFDLPLVIKSPLFRWTADGRGLIYVDNRNQAFNLWSQTLDNSPPTQLTDFKTGEIFRFDSAINDKNFAVAHGHESSDVIMIDNLK